MNRLIRTVSIVSCLVAIGVTAPALRAQAPAEIQAAVDAAYAKYKSLQ